MVYKKEEIEQSLKCLFDVAHVFNKHRSLMNRFVLTGGWAPYFITKGRFEHTGSRDVDLVLKPTIMIAYTKIAKLMKDALYFEQTRPFEFVKWMDDVRTEVHFLCEPESIKDLPKDMAIYKMQEGLYPTIIDGCSIVFKDCFKQQIESGRKKETILMSDLVSTLSLKAHAFDNRRSEKDAYDIYVLITHGRDSINEVVEEIKKWKNNKFVTESIKIIKSLFNTVSSVGPIRAATYLHPVGGNMFDSERKRVFGAISEFIKFSFK